MKRKCLAVGIILLLVGTFIIPVIAQDIEKPSQSTSRGNWMYVGGSGPGNYTKIQDAVNNASNSDTIFVYKGVYSDYYPSGQFGYTVCIDKEITLLGEDKNDTIINGTGSAITVKVSANNVEINGFTIQNGGGSFCGGIRIMDTKTGTRIYNDIIKNNNAGVFMMFNVNAQVRNSIIENNGNGIYVFDSYAANIMDNIIQNNTNGITIVYNSHAICRNEIRNNSVGIIAENTHFIAQANNFINNTKHVDISKGVYLSSFPLYIKTRNFWSRNYWDDWTKKLPRPVKGLGVIAIHLPRTDIPILTLPYYEIDFRPNQIPYTIKE